MNTELRLAIAAATTPGRAKRMGRVVPLRSDWEQVKDSIMEELIRSKFQDRSLAFMLWSTGSKELIEGNSWHDTYWGMCNGVGRNQLGKILMKIREEIRIKNYLICELEKDLR